MCCDGAVVCAIIARKGMRYERLPEQCKNYHFDELLGIIDIKSKLFYVYELNWCG